jgi:hypothetical protein
VELSRHDVIDTEGLPVESYLDAGDRACFSNGGAMASLFPTFGADRWEMHGCAPLLLTGPAVAKARHTLEARADRTRWTRRTNFR